MTQVTEGGIMPLADGFEPRTREDWQQLVARVLDRGRDDGGHTAPEDAEEALRTALDGGLTTRGLYLRTDRPLGVPGAMPFTRGRAIRDGAAPWDVRQLHDEPDPRRARTAVLDDLEHGVTSVWVHVGDDGLAVADLPEVLADVRPDLAPVAVSSFTDQPAAARALLEVLADRDSVGGNLGLDPVGAALRTGVAPDLAPLADLVGACGGRPGWRAITVDARVLHDAGASEVDALAVAVATGVHYLRHLDAAGVSPADAFPHVEFRVSATADQFLTAATLRALRRVWARVGEACGVPEADRGARTHAVTSLRMASREDPFVNVLRNTVATFGASIGGADAITVLPHDTVAGLPGRFSRRLARNTQILLAEESNVGRVTDPGGGSWYLESLTDDVAERVWARFQELERAGGVEAARAGGLLQQWVDATAAERARLIAVRARPLTGVSLYPDLAAAVAERRPRADLPTHPGAFEPRRDAAPFEALRDRARALGSPQVTVPATGAPADGGARRSFVTNLLAAGGIAATEEPGPVVVDDTVDDGVDAVAFLTDVLDRLGAPTTGATR
ncbi:methylmalonyl-CoA mutase subunit beta [uncultured Phycicoccus sp.]|uniref:methylmalonyl-CoA mutase subunit beta n=1 Tax=uncultured Phycicoccus sp. TaxID=661422 RepID=UPI0026061323|nr:methylmalonyl-CoA mutase subunit beta [uncultured Phycicoccus sp.]